MTLVVDEDALRRCRGAMKKAIVVLLSLFFVACGETASPSFQLSGETMGTTYHLTVVEQAGDLPDRDALQKAVDAQLQLVNSQMSTYLPDSELSRLNRAPVGQPFKVSPNLFDVLMLSLEVSWLSDGAFDVTVAPLVDLWGFGPGDPTAPDRVPEAAVIADKLKNTGFTNLEFDLVKSTVTKQRDVKLDLSGIAKGYGVDKVAELLDYAGYQNYMVEIGGELRLKGLSPRGTPWRIAIEEPDPAGLQSVHRAIAITDRGLATSGDYRNFFEVDGRRYSHTIDPKTGYPITHNLASVTVVEATSARADALATALDVLGPEKGIQLAEQQGLAVYMIVKGKDGFESRYTKPFARFLESGGDP